MLIILKILINIKKIMADKNALIWKRYSWDAEFKETNFSKSDIPLVNTSQIKVVWWKNSINKTVFTTFFIYFCISNRVL